MSESDQPRHTVAAFLASAAVGLGSLVLIEHLCGLPPASGREHGSRPDLLLAACGLVSGLGALVMLWRRSRPQPGEVPGWIWVPVLVSVFTCSVGLTDALRAVERAHILRTVEAATLSAKAGIEELVVQRANTLERMGDRWEERGGTPRAEWEADADRYLRDQPGLLSLVWADSSGRARWVRPAIEQRRWERTGEEKDGVFRVALLAGQRKGRPVLAVAERPPEGGARALLVVPVHAHLRLAGFLVGELDVSALLMPRLASLLSRGYRLEVTERGRPILDWGAATHSPQQEGWSSRADLGLPGTTWRLLVSPGKKLLGDLRSPLPAAALLLGSLLAALLALSVHLSHRSRRQSRRLAQVNAELESLNEALELRNISVTHDLLESEGRLSELLEAAPDAVLIADRDERIVKVNAAVEQLFGYQRGDALGRRLEELLPQSSVGTRQVGVDDLLASGIRGDGSSFPASVRICLSHAGGTTRTMAIVRDLSAYRELERRLAKVQRMEAIGRLAGGIAHDFNNLLSIIGGSADLLLARWPEGDPGRADVDQIRETVRAGGALVCKLMAFGRRQVLQPRTLDLNSAILDSEEMLRRLLGERIDLEIELAPDLWFIRADPSQVEQVLVNLTVNALEAMQHGGRVRITTRNVAAAASQLNQEGDHVLLAVHDTGCGIAEEDLDRVFEPFFTTRGGHAGGGLGLSSVHGIVEQSGGEVRVSSSPGVGSTFEVFFPRSSGSPEESPASSTAVPGRSGAAGSGAILLVEDDSVLRRVVGRMLARWGYRVLSAESPSEALAMVEDPANAIDLLLTDVVLPEMNGKELADRILGGRPDLAVLFMSGHTEVEFIERAGQDDGIRFIQKPFEAEDLSAAIQRALE